MIRRPTVLILGAGGSKPYRLPLGFELRDAVLRAGTTFPTTHALDGSGIPHSSFTAFAAALATSGFSSVDAFLEHRAEWLPAGKAAMALCLLMAEYAARPCVLPPQQPRDHWYQTLWSHIKAPTWEAFKAQPLVILTFNYDRTLEHYLVQILASTYSVSHAAALASLPISHVHGSLGPYDYSRFGAPVTDESIAAAARSIIVVHEADVAQSGFAAARRQLATAERALFIGLGYLDANMRKLGFIEGQARHEGVTIAGTHKGIKAGEWSSLCARYGFAPTASRHGGGSISTFLSEWLP